nr:heme ABC transporter substrate-binding protein IsdE [uncultured Dorea sp.]
MMNRWWKRGMAVLLTATALTSLTACVNQNQKELKKQESSAGVQTDDTISLEIDDPQEKKAVETAKKKVQESGGDPKIIATSPAVAEICDKLELDLTGVCESSVSTIPKRYKDATTVGTAMSPDMEVVASLDPDWILSPISLQSDLQPKYEAIGSDWAFLNLRSVQGMYRSIQELGEIFDREEQAQKEVDKFTKFYKEYKKKSKDQEKPKVMILMGLPGSYVIATPNSYVGSLVELAGGENVYPDSDQEFLNVNTEDMKTKEPDIILRTAHALPDQVMEMFEKDFAENDIWQHFEAVKNKRVYDLSYGSFGMSANFKYQDALEELQGILYPENDDGNEADNKETHAGKTSEQRSGDNAGKHIEKNEERIKTQEEV